MLRLGASSALLKGSVGGIPIEFLIFLGLIVTRDRHSCR